MRHFDAWVIRDPYSIWHYYTTGQRWKDTVRELIHDRKICAPSPHPQATSISGYPGSPSTSPTINSTINTDTGFIQQTKSPLFTRLPPEIRAIIWEYVFDADTIHLVTIKDKVRHVRCCCSSRSSTSSPDKSLTHHRHCCPTTLARWRNLAPPSSSPSSQNQQTQTLLLYPHTHPSLPATLSNSTPSLLRTCHLIHTETSHLLYKNTTFDIDDLYTFIAFTQSLSPTALSHIRSLTLHWTPIWTPLSGQDHKSSIYAHTHSDELWLHFWARVAALPGLREVKLVIDLGAFTGRVMPDEGVVLGGSGNRIPLVLGEAWTVPLLAVRGLGVFEMVVTARCDELARGVLEAGIVRDAEVLRDGLRGVMCSGHAVGLESVLAGVGVDWKKLRSLEEWVRRRGEEKIGKGRGGQRLAIMAA